MSESMHDLLTLHDELTKIARSIEDPALKEGLEAAARIVWEAIEQVQDDITIEPESDGLCCRIKHMAATPPWTCDCACHTRS